MEPKPGDVIAVCDECGEILHDQAQIHPACVPERREELEAQISDLIATTAQLMRRLHEQRPAYFLIGVIFGALLAGLALRVAARE